MSGTEQFPRTIAEYLNLRAATDPLFAPNLAKPYKNIEDCITYILKQVQQSACNGLEDDEIYSMEEHYYDEDDLEVGSHVACYVVVNHTLVLTEEEKEEARKQAIQQYQAQELSRFQEPRRTKSKASTESEQCKEELEHAEDMMHCIIQCGGKVKIQSIPTMETEFASVLEVAEKAYAHECLVSEKMEELVRLASTEADMPSQNFFWKYIREQVEEEATASKIVDRGRLASDHAIIFLDKELASR